MKLRTLSVGAIYCILNTAFATPVFERPLDNGMDNAIVDAFVEATSQSAIDDTKSISIDVIKNAIDTLKITDNKLLVSFDDNKLQTILQNKGIATWSGLKDPVLVWFANVDENNLSVLNADGLNDFAVALNQASIKNNYNLMFPLMDLDDAQLVDAQTILSHSDNKLVKASKRYGTQFFVAGALEKNNETNEYTVKWNVFDASGKALGNGQDSGTLDTASQDVSRQIAKVLMNNVAGDTQDPTQTATDTQDPNQQDTLAEENALGPVEGGVKVLFTGVDNVADYPKIRKALITYGYEADISVVGYNQSGVIFYIPTNSNPSILDGTLAHAGEFTKVAPWTYKYNHSLGQATTLQNTGSITKSSTTRVTSQIKNYDDKAFTKHTVKTKTDVTTETVSDEGAPVITLTDDNEAQGQALELQEGVAITE